MEEVLRVTLGLPLDALYESLLGVDCEQSRFGTLLCRRLGYMQVRAGSWSGAEASGLTREVNCVVKCPPKPMLPDTTRVTIRHRLWRDERRVLLERELATLDVPYGESFCVQERWLATAGADGSCELGILCHVHFRTRLLLHAKILKNSLKQSRKAAAVAAELFEEVYFAGVDLGGMAQVSGGAHGARPAVNAIASELAALQEKFNTLLEEAAFSKRRAEQLERENRRLQAVGAYTRQSKRHLNERVASLQEELQRERRARALETLQERAS